VNTTAANGFRIALNYLIQVSEDEKILCWMKRNINLFSRFRASTLIVSPSHKHANG